MMPAGKVLRQSGQKAARALQEVTGKKLFGFAPTPAPLVEKMLAHANLRPGVTVLEPSAGLGHIADRLRSAGAKVSVVEQDVTMREILAGKRHQVIGDDILTLSADKTFDRIIMNPPFNFRQDIAHLFKAFQHLKPGGTLVAIVGNGAFKGSAKDHRSYQRVLKSFRLWLEALGAHVEKLPKGSFMTSERRTNIDTRMIVITKQATKNAGVAHTLENLNRQLRGTLDDLGAYLEHARSQADTPRHIWQVPEKRFNWRTFVRQFQYPASTSNKAA